MARKGGLMGSGVGIIVLGAVGLYFLALWGQRRKAAALSQAARALQGVRLTF